MPTYSQDIMRPIAVKESSIKLQSSIRLLAFPTTELYSMFRKNLSLRQSIPESYDSLSDSLYGTLFGDLISLPSKIKYFGSNEDFMYSGEKYCANSKYQASPAKWFNYITEQYECINDIESAATALEALQIVFGAPFDHCMVYTKIAVSEHCQDGD